MLEDVTRDCHVRCRVPVEFSSRHIFYLFLIIALAGDQCRQPVTNSTRHVAILWRFSGMAAQILCASRGINIGRFPGVLDSS
jgi:hypothetical protein